MSLSSDLELPSHPSDVELDQIQRQIQCNLSMRIDNLRLRACEDGLVLEGQAKTYYAKQLVQQAVVHATGLRVPANNIAIG